MSFRFQVNKNYNLGKEFRKHFCNDLTIEDLINSVQALEFTNEEERQTHQQQILRLNEEHRRSLKEKEQEINDLKANRHAAHRGSFANVFKKNSEEAHPHCVI